MDPLFDRTVGAFLDALADPEPTPGGGSAAAVAVAMAASLLAMTARASRDHWADAAGAAAQAVALRERVAPFADETAAAYADVLELLAEPDGESQERRDFRLGAALARAAAVPLLIAETASDVAELGLFVVERGAPERRPDAAAAVLLADAAAQIAAHLVAVNLSAQSDDERAVRARRAAAATGEASRRVLTAT